MLIIYHDGTKVVEVNNSKASVIARLKTLTIAEVLIALSQEFPDEILIWCHSTFKKQLNILEIESLFHHKKFLFSYTPFNSMFLDKRIGYVEESPFIKVNKKSTYPTWQMSNIVGGVHAEVFLTIKAAIPLEKNFDYFLCSLAKLGISNGLLCYSEPRLLLENPDEVQSKTDMFTLFRFVKQHYKTQWVFLLFFNLIVYERKFPIVSLIKSLSYKNRNKIQLNLNSIKVVSTNSVESNRTIDVLIPTIGRKEYLYQVLKDFSQQTLLPTTIIIVEQNPIAGSESELNFIKDENWPFKIQHLFINQSGACNARNLALEKIESEWVFFADDDIRIEANFIEKAFYQIYNFGAKAVSFRCFQKGESKVKKVVFQWSSFGSGCSIVYTDSLKHSQYNKGYEFGFGEDGDFGMQLRNQGVDILYLPNPEILHLKAPIGGFRTKPVLQWQNDRIQPKPSPTIMLYQISHNTTEQIRGYKTILFFKFYKLQQINNPIKYYNHFQKQWNRSLFWANYLKQQNEV
jgi:glycosyltransferase involved in cell wall biosynthesis